ncbi:hypothetical protein [Kribbella speibonae]|uniref:Uncharacterized protein n=1 Tax=Kribbella speibonae TaxID=1572660 RepID=A0A4R0J3T1_9ACTN|nr:hypothetical protein [Kribbella speibonae]TCC38886.1 hypothetical protein E0H92_21200 [Kribbella speibonae]
MSNDDEEDELSLVVRLVWQVVRKSSFPPPDPHNSWTHDAVVDQAVNLYLAKGGAVVAEAVAAAGGDQGHLERRLLKTIRNYMIDVAKSTPIGLMRNRLATMLLRHPGYVRLEGDKYPLAGWAPAGSQGATGDLWQGDEDTLHASAINTPIPTEIVFNRSGPPPAATKQALLDVIAAVFAAADGFYLPDQALARVVARRFDEFLDPDGRDVAAYTSPADPETISDFSSADPTTDVHLERIEAADIADWLWTEFTWEERTIYPFLDVPENEDGRIASVVIILGCGDEEAKATIDAMLTKIREHAPNVELARYVLDELTAIHKREHLDGSPDGTT